MMTHCDDNYDEYYFFVNTVIYIVAVRVSGVKLLCTDCISCEMGEVLDGIVWHVHTMKWNWLCGTVVVQAVCVWHAVPAMDNPLHEWKFSISSVKTLTRCRRSVRSMFLYVHENSDDFHIIFPTSEHRERCYERVVALKCSDTDNSGKSNYSSDGNLIDIQPNIPHVRETFTLSAH